MSITKVILEKIHFFMLWNSKHDIKMVTMISNHWRTLPNSLFPTKNIRCTQKVQFKDRNWRHQDADFVIWVADGHFGINPKWGFKVLQNLNPMILSQFCPYRYIHPYWIWGFKSRQPHLGDMPASTSDCTHTMSCKCPESGHWAICN